MTVTTIKVVTEGQGSASVFIVTLPGAVGKRVGSVERGDYGWVPLTRNAETRAHMPQFPHFKTRQAAAEALANGEVVYG